MGDDRGSEATEDWIATYQQTGDRRLRNRVVEAHLHVVEHYARRYGGRGIPVEDLRQVGALAMVRSVDRFDPSQGASFATFAGRTVDGELKRWFRDRSWSVRPPRRAQELHLSVRKATEELSHQLGRAPSVEELATELDVDVDHVLEALEASGAHRAASLDQPRPGDEGGQTLADRIEGGDGGDFGRVDTRVVIDDLLARLPERDQKILRLRFEHQMSQPEIAELMGVSQSYLSRLLRRTLAELRSMLEDGDNARQGG